MADMALARSKNTSILTADFDFVCLAVKSQALGAINKTYMCIQKFFKVSSRQIILVVKKAMSVRVSSGPTVLQTNRILAFASKRLNFYDFANSVKFSIIPMPFSDHFINDSRTGVDLQTDASSLCFDH